MATPSSEIKPDRPGGNGWTHRDLISEAERYLADIERGRDPNLSYSRAFARATRALAKAIGVEYSTVRAMRSKNRVAANHWHAIERATEGHVTARQFDGAAHG